VVPYGYENWFPILKEAHGLKVLQNRIELRIFEEGEMKWNEVHSAS
jgi:hypothetical protein